MHLLLRPAPLTQEREVGGGRAQGGQERARGGPESPHPIPGAARDWGCPGLGEALYALLPQHDDSAAAEAEPASKQASRRSAPLQLERGYPLVTGRQWRQSESWCHIRTERGPLSGTQADMSVWIFRQDDHGEKSKRLEPSHEDVLPKG